MRDPHTGKCLVLAVWDTYPRMAESLSAEAFLLPVDIQNVNMELGWHTLHKPAKIILLLFYLLNIFNFETACVLFSLVSQVCGHQWFI